MLSNFVRYYQDEWLQIIEGKDSGVISLIEFYMRQAKYMFPVFILNSLTKENHSFGSPGYLT